MQGMQGGKGAAGVSIGLTCHCTALCAAPAHWSHVLHLHSAQCALHICPTCTPPARPSHFMS